MRSCRYVLAGSALPALLATLSLVGCGEPADSAAAPAPPAAEWTPTPPPAMPEISTDDVDLDSPLLAAEERERIALIENRVLILSSRSFPAIAEHLHARDAPALRAVLAPDFAAVCLLTQHERRAEGVWSTQLARSDDPDVKTFDADAEAFARYLLALRDEFSDDCRVGFAVRGLAPVDAAAPDGAWTGRCRLRIAGERGAGEPAEVFLELGFDAVRIAPSDEARDAKAWLARVRVLELSRGWARQPLMAEVATERGFDVESLHDNWTAGGGGIVTGGVYTADLDDDGRLEVLVTDVTGVRLYRGLPEGRFEDITEAARLPREIHPDACILLADLNGDARVDVVLGNRVFANEGDLRFLEITTDAFLPIEGANGATVADFDLDGRLDVYATYSYKRTPGPRRTTWFAGAAGPGNQLWQNRGRWQFESVAPRVGALAGKRSSATSAWLDANLDGRPDIYVISEFGPGVLLLNGPDGTFREHYLEGDDGDFGTMGLAVGDYDNDGFTDIFTANMYSKAGRRIIENLSRGTYEPHVLRRIKRFITGSELYRNVGDGTFERRAADFRIQDVGWSYGASFLDLDNDGFLDLYATTGFISVTRGEPDG